MDRIQIAALAAGFVLAGGALRAADRPDCCAAHTAAAAAPPAKQATRTRPTPSAAAAAYTASHAPGVVVRHIPSPPPARGGAPASIAILPGGTRPAATPVLPQVRTGVAPEAVITPSGAVMAYAPPEAVAYATATLDSSGRVEVRCDDRAAPARGRAAVKPAHQGKVETKPAAPRAAPTRK